MKKYVFLIICSIFTITLTQNLFALTEIQYIKKDTLKSNEPKVDIKVNKKYDDYGNLIQYDSTYSYVYSSQNMNSEDLDSIIGNFKPFFYNNMPDVFGNSFDDFFNSRSFSNEDFFKNDFFENQFQKHNKMMEDMISKMDSIRNEYLKQKYPKIEDNNNHIKPVPQKTTKKTPNIQNAIDL